MRIDTLGLQAFIEIADSGSFIAAANRLNITQTALSHRVAKLEAMLGVALIARTSRRLALTPEGLALLPRARGALVDLQSALYDLRQLGDVRKREVTFGCIPSIAGAVIPELLGEFAKLMPDVRVRVLDGYAYVIASQVNAAQAEFGVTVRSTTHFELAFEPLIEEAFVAVCREDHPAARYESITWEELRAFKLIGNSVANDALRNVRDLASWNYQVETISTALGFVSAGLGVSIIPALMREHIGGQNMRTLPITSPLVTRPVCFVTRPDMPQSEAAATLMDLIKVRLKAMEQAEAP